MATTDQTKALVENAQKPQTMEDLLMSEKVRTRIAAVLPKQFSPERLLNIVVSQIRVTPDLAKCTQESILGAVMTSTLVGLEPGVAGRAYILPFNNSRKKPDGSWHSVKEAQFVIGYKGLIDLFYRHTKAVQIDWGIVREGDDFDYELGSNAFLKHKPKLGNTGAPSAYWVMAHLAGGGRPFKVMGAEECMAHGREHSKTFDSKKQEFYASSPWSKEPDAMCLKTVLIQLAKVLPLSVELQRVIAADESTRDFRDALRDGLESKTQTEWNPPVETTAAPPEDAPPDLPPGVKAGEPEIPFGE
jgi:recombination protein RecT